MSRPSAVRISHFLPSLLLLLAGLAAAYVKDHVTKPVIGYIAGVTAPKGKRMGHAGAIISGGKGTAEEKFKAFEDAGIAYTRDPSKIGEKVKEVTGW